MSAFTTSETPFSVWVINLRRRYEEFHSEKPFISEDIFRSVWFAYVQLQIRDGDMACPTCGPTPSETIWDGVTLAFNRKHLLPTLQAPTTVTPTSEVHHSCSVKSPQFVVDPGIREGVLAILRSKHLPLVLTLLGPKQVEFEADDAKQLAKLVVGIPAICDQLSEYSHPLGTFFSGLYGLHSLKSNGALPHHLFRRLFEQVMFFKTRNVISISMQIIITSSCLRNQYFNL